MRPIRFLLIMLMTLNGASGWDAAFRQAAAVCRDAVVLPGSVFELVFAYGTPLRAVASLMEKEYPLQKGSPRKKQGRNTPKKNPSNQFSLVCSADPLPKLIQAGLMPLPRASGMTGGSFLRTAEDAAHRWFCGASPGIMQAALRTYLVVLSLKNLPGEAFCAPVRVVRFRPA